jgi:hypothetical protein
MDFDGSQVSRRKRIVDAGQLQEAHYFGKQTLFRRGFKV